MNKIYIPHLHYEIEVKDFKKAPKELKLKKETCIALAVKYDNCTADIFVQLPIKTKDIPTVAHEVFHIIQFICQDRHIDFIEEKENTAYLFQYILNKVIGYHYIK